MKTSVLLIGGFDMTKALASSLLKKGYKVTAIYPNYEKCKLLAEIDGLQVINGDGTKPFILEEAGATDMNIAIALTDHDDDNLVICELCKKKFGVKKTVCTIKNGENTAFFRKMGVDAVVCATNAITSIIEQQAFVDEMTTVIPIGDGRLSIAEIPISETAPAVGKKLWEINLPKEVIIGCIMRQESNIIPRGDTRVLAGDVLILLSSAKQETTAVHQLTGR